MIRYRPVFGLIIIALLLALTVSPAVPADRAGISPDRPVLIQADDEEDDGSEEAQWHGPYTVQTIRADADYYYVTLADVDLAEIIFRGNPGAIHRLMVYQTAYIRGAQLWGYGSSSSWSQVQVGKDPTAEATE